MSYRCQGKAYCNFFLHSVNQFVGSQSWHSYRHLYLLLSLPGKRLAAFAIANLSTYTLTTASVVVVLLFGCRLPHRRLPATLQGNGEHDEEHNSTSVH